MGTGAIKHLDDTHAELKSMRTRAVFRGRGIAQHLLSFMIGQVRAFGYRRLSLETGTQPFFAPAHRLYLRNGFVECAPFADYVLDPNSRFMTREL